MVENPNPLMIDPLKLVRTPLGTLEPNMATVRSQLTRQRRVLSCLKSPEKRRAMYVLLGISQSFKSMGPVEGRGLDTNSRSGDSLNGHWSVFWLDPLGS
jgi:hypothetical protein